MKINSLNLINFRNKERFDISFPTNFTVLIGDNGAGKTTILEAITKAFVPVLKNAKIDMSKRDLNLNDIMFDKMATSVAITVKLNNQEYTFGNRKRVSPLVEFEKNDSVSYGGDRGDMADFKKVYMEQLQNKRLPLVLYYGTDRVIKSVPVRGHIKEFQVADAMQNCFDNAYYFRDFYDWFKTEEDIELRKMRFDKTYRNPHLECIRQALERMITGYHDLRIELNPSRMVMTNEKGADLRIEQLSGGYKAVLSVVADIAKRLSLAYPDSSAPLNEEAVILIDELDLHLHPKWQKTIIADLKRTFPNIQFIVSTHSPFIVQSVRANELYNIETECYAGEEESFGGWSIDSIQDKQMGVEPKTISYNTLIKEFTRAVDDEQYDKAKKMYQELVNMINPESTEKRLLDMDMEMMVSDD